MCLPVVRGLCRALRVTCRSHLHRTRRCRTIWFAVTVLLPSPVTVAGYVHTCVHVRSVHLLRYAVHTPCVYVFFCRYTPPLHTTVLYTHFTLPGCLVYTVLHFHTPCILPFTTSATVRVHHTHATTYAFHAVLQFCWVMPPTTTHHTHTAHTHAPRTFTLCICHLFCLNLHFGCIPFRFCFTGSRTLRSDRSRRALHTFVATRFTRAFTRTHGCTPHRLRCYTRALHTRTLVLPHLPAFVYFALTHRLLPLLPATACIHWFYARLHHTVLRTRLVYCATYLNTVFCLLRFTGSSRSFGLQVSFTAVLLPPGSVRILPA